jgi:hypothetical protein
MVWEDNEVPMKNRHSVKRHIYRMHVEDSPVIQQAEARKMKILDADYSAVDLAGTPSILSMSETLKRLKR